MNRTDEPAGGPAVSGSLDPINRPELRDVQARALKGSAWGLFSSLIGLPLTIVSTVILAREFGASGFGLYALYSFVVPTMIQLSDLGLTSGLVQRGAAAYGGGDIETLKKLTGQALTWSLLRWPFLYVGLAIVLDDPVAAALLGVVALVSVACSGVGLALICTVRNAELSRIALLGSVAAALTTIGCALSGTPPVRVLAAGLAAQYLALSLQVLYLRRDPVLKRAAFRPRSLAGGRDDLIFGGATFASSQMAALTLSRSELLFFTPGQEVARGIYAAAYTIGSRLTLPLDAIYGSLGSSLAAVTGQGDAYVRGAMRTLRLSGSLFSLVAGPAIFLALLGSDLLFPATYAGVGQAAVVLASGSLLVSSVNPMLALYYARRRIRPLVRAAGLALALNLALSFVLIPEFGLWGAVTANAIAASVYVMSLLVPLLSEGPLQRSVRDYVRVAGLALGSAGLIAFAVSAIDSDALRWSVAGVLSLLHPMAVLRLLPSVHSADLQAVHEHAPRRLAPVLMRAERLLVRARPN